MGACLSKPAADAGGEAAAAANSTSSSVAAAAPVSQHKQQQQQQQQHAVDPQAVQDDAQQDDLRAPDEYAGAPAPVCELARIQHLHSFNILYTKPEQRFDSITQLCTMVFKVPIALVSLVDTQVQWFKSAQGLGGTVDRTPRNTSFCAWTLLPAYPEALVVEDAQQDDRFAANPLVVGPPFIRFYAGCPLVASNGMRLGSLCIIDAAPRAFDATSCNLLANMAEMVTREIEKDAALAQQQQQTEQQKLLRRIDAFTEAIMLVELDPAVNGRWTVMHANEAWEALAGRPRPHDAERLAFWQVFQLPRTSRTSLEGWVAAETSAAIRAQQNFELQLLAAGAPTPRLLQAQFRCAATTSLDPNMPPIGIPNFLPDAAASEEGSSSSRTFYFATLRDAPEQQQQQQQPQQQKQAQQQQRQQHGSNSSSWAASAQQRLGSTASSGGPRSGRPPSSAFTLMLAGSNEPFPEIKLGPLLGKGAFGRVYRGMWQGRQVAVKIIEFTQAEGAPGPLEGLLGEQVAHANVVTTYKHATQVVELLHDTSEDEDDTLGSGSVGPTDRRWQPLVAGGEAAPAGPITSNSSSRSGGAHRAPRKQLMETWLVLEFCNRGCVSDAIEKGWFRQQPPRAPSTSGAAGGSAAASSATRGAGGPYHPNLSAVLATAREIAAALSYLHHKNMLHGDLTGGNVLLTAAPSALHGFTAKVSDFGLSRLVSHNAPVIETRTYGTVTHCSPELLLYGQLSKPADVYSLGVVVWEMATGRRPYAGMSHSMVLHAISTGRSLEVPTHSIPDGLAALLAACLAKEPEKRPTAAEALDTLMALEEAHLQSLV